MRISSRTAATASVPSNKYPQDEPRRGQLLLTLAASAFYGWSPGLYSDLQAATEKSQVASNASEWQGTRNTAQWLVLSIYFSCVVLTTHSSSSGRWDACKMLDISAERKLTQAQQGLAGGSNRASACWLARFGLSTAKAGPTSFQV
jgi:hypothetical protein